MGRAQGHPSRGKNKASLPQTPKNMKYDRMSEEYAAELNNQSAWKNKHGQMPLIKESKGTKINRKKSFFHLIPLFERGF